MPIPLNARREHASIAQHVAPLLDEVFQAVKRMSGLCESGHNAPTLGGSVKNSQSPINRRRAVMLDQCAKPFPVPVNGPDPGIERGTGQKYGPTGLFRSASGCILER